MTRTSPTAAAVATLITRPAALWLALTAASCGGSPPAGSAGGPPPPGASTDGSVGPAPSVDLAVPFAGLSAEAYLAKVKDLLVGQAPTNDELVAVRHDPTMLRALIDRWMGTPEYQAKMLLFFRNAFQQGQITSNDLVDQLPAGLRANPSLARGLLRSIQESFARTVMQLVAEGRPFSETVTTRRYMLNPPLMALLAYIDSLHVDDKGGRVDRTLKANPKFAFTLHNSGPAIPIADTLNPGSPSYLHWNNPIAIPKNAPAGCLVDTRTYTRNTQALFDFLLGYLDGYNGQACQPSYTGTAQLPDSDLDAWRMVTVRAPGPGEQPSHFYDLPALRSATELRLTVPRVGFFTTPAFFANWQTNTSNLARVTMNQTLIVALGASFDDSNDITPVSEVGLDQGHAAPGSPCYSCHKTLDPMRQYFRQAFTLYYHEQTDPTQVATLGTFAFGGVTTPGKDIYDLADKLASHPNFAPAWAQKVCFWANSAACSTDDPEFVRVVSVWRSSGLDFRVLLREMLASPLTTGASNTKTFDDRGLVVNVARRDSLCTALSTRLGIADVCGLAGSKGVGKAAELSTGVPSDGYDRGSVAPVLANDSSLFHRAATENLCRTIADSAVDTNGSRYSSARPDAAIADLVQNLISLASSDPRSAPVQKILTDHFDAARGAGLKPGDALKSTFVLACESPTSVARGL